MKNYKNFDLKKISWIKIGGTVRDLFVVENNDELVSLAKNHVERGEAFEIIGWGSNTLFADGYHDYTIILVKTNELKLLDFDSEWKKIIFEKIDKKEKARHIVYKDSNVKSGFDTDDLDYSDDDKEDIVIEVDSGVGMPYLINKSIDMGATGLSFFSGIPGTVGGGVFNNIHGGKKMLSDYLLSVTYIDNQGLVKELFYDDNLYNYNETIFKKDGLIVLKSKFHLKKGDILKARQVAVEWAKRKSSQPKNSLGSVFHNLDSNEISKYDLPTGSIAYLIEHKLGLSGYRVGNIMIPEKTDPSEVQVNKNIFMNLGGGKAEEFLAVMDKVWLETYQKFGIKLKAEIFFKGFPKDRVDKYL
jgi:UDP-N-acetylmuramate dehydrogenase